MPNVPNQFEQAISLTANNVNLAATGGMTLAEGTVTGNLMLTAVTGDLKQTGPLTVNGESQLTANSGSILFDAANRFANEVTLNATDVTLHTATALTLAASAVSGDLKLTADAGDVTQTGPLDVAGTSNITAKSGNVTLDNAANNFGDSVSVESSKALKLTSSGALALDQMKIGMDADIQSHGALNLGSGSYLGKLKANSGGFDITQSGPVTFAGDTNFDAGNAKIDLFNPYNMWRGAILFKAGIVLINHPVLMNAVNAGTLIVRANTAMPNRATSTDTSTTSMSLKPLQSTPKAGPAISIYVDSKTADNNAGLITVALSSETASPGRSFSFEIDPKVVSNQPSDTVFKVSQLDGKPLPDWLKYEPATKTFTATEIPAGAFPLQLKVGSGGQETVMVIKESDTKP